MSIGTDETSDELKKAAKRKAEQELERVGLLLGLHGTRPLHVFVCTAKKARVEALCNDDVDMTPRKTDESKGTSLVRSVHL
jgi:hypothetical protein